MSVGRLIRRFGMFLALGAALSLAAHVAHQDSDHGTADAHHCCLCHTSSIAAAPAAALSAPISFVAYAVSALPASRPAGRPILLNAPRAPPWA